MFDNKNNEKNLIQIGTPETGLEHQLVMLFKIHLLMQNILQINCKK